MTDDMMPIVHILETPEPVRAGPLDCPESIFALFHREARADREMHWALHLNADLKLIKKELVAMGGMTEMAVEPGIVLRGALLSAAPSIVLVHNHPHGNPSPSKDDRTMWKAMRKACELLSIDLVDNIIISTGGCYSEKLRKTTRIRKRKNPSKERG